MKQTTYRTTFALDEKSKQNLEMLSKKWKVSKAEVIRKMIQNTVEMEPEEENDALKAFNKFMAKGGIPKERAEKWVKEIREDRDNFYGRG